MKKFSKNFLHERRQCRYRQFETDRQQEIKMKNSFEMDNFRLPFDEWSWFWTVLCAMFNSLAISLVGIPSRYRIRKIFRRLSGCRSNQELTAAMSSSSKQRESECSVDTAICS